VADPKFAEWQHWVHVNAAADAVGAGLPAAAWGGESITAYFGPAPGQGKWPSLFARLA
jgi:hypothetical protein